MADIKYLHCVAKITNGMKLALDEVPRRGGSYNWLFLHKGVMMPYRDIDNFEDYDVVAVNMAPVDQMLVPLIRDRIPKSSSTLLVLNNDYVAESWDSWRMHPQQYDSIQKLGDAVFGTEPYQTSQLIDGAYCIPHPHWIHMLKRIGNDDLDPDKLVIGNLFHWWEGRTYTQSLMMQRLRLKFPKLWSRIYAHNTANDKSGYWTKAMFDEHIDGMQYPDFIRSLQTCNVVSENCAYHTYGRTTVDTAALGIPSVGSDRVFSMKHCWPKLSFDPFDIKAINNATSRLLTDDKWRQEQLDYAYEACEYFNYPNSKERYMEMIEDTRKRLGK